MSYPLNLVESESWLKSKDEKDFVGTKGCSISCPISKCLQDKKEQVYAVGEQNTAKEALQILNNLYICTVCNTYNPEGTNCGKKDNCPW